MKLKFKATGAAAVVSALGLLLGATPAMAAGAGVTTDGFSTITGTGSGLPTCLKTSNTPSITLDNAGTVQAGTGVYAGTSTATFNLNGPFYFNPAATYGSDSTCTVPGGVPLSSTNAGGLSGASATGSVSCTWSSGTYTRVTNAYTITVSGSCTIKDVNGVVTGSGNETFVFTGNENPCLPVVNNCDLVNNTEFGPGAYAAA